jgi:hypothetical protein
MLLTREQILAADDTSKRETVPVPEWFPDGEVLVGVMLGHERDKFEVEYQRAREGKSPNGIRAWLAAATLVDERGKRLFTPSDVTALARKSSIPLDRIWDVATRINGLTQKDVEALQKNSPAAPSGDSGSSSQES